MSKARHNIPLTIALLIAFLFVLLGSHSAHATTSNYVPLSAIPGLTSGGAASTASCGTDCLSQYVKGLYQWGVALTSGLAVIVVMYGGVQYVTSAGGGGIEEAKGRIQAAIMGLLLALGSYIILQTINKDLLNVNFTMQTVTVNASGALAPGYVAGTDTSYSGAGGSFDSSGDGGGSHPYSSDEFGGSNQNVPVTNDVGGSSDPSTPYQHALAANGTPTYDGQTITANNPAVDTDGTGNPGFDNGYTADGRPQHQVETSYQVNGVSLDATRDDYVAMPTADNIPPGTPVLITRTDNATGAVIGQVQAISGDNGATGYGEMSVHAAQAIGIWQPPNPATGTAGSGNSVNVGNTTITYTIGRAGTPLTQAGNSGD